MFVTLLFMGNFTPNMEISTDINRSYLDVKKKPTSKRSINTFTLGFNVRAQRTFARG